ARSRAYRWNEDGLAGFCDDGQRLCFAIALWNGNDPILKERLFGLSGNEGNHGEDLKEQFYYLDSTPTHSYCKCLYKYPQRVFPYQQLVEVNENRSRDEWEWEILDSGVFDEDRYFDVFVEYAKAAPNDILIQITIANRGPEAARLHLLPTLWFRNTWAWKGGTRPRMWAPEPDDTAEATQRSVIQAEHKTLGSLWLLCHANQDSLPELLFCENETNKARLFGGENAGYVKDGINDFVLHGANSVNPQQEGTKASAHYVLELAPGQEKVIQLRLLDDMPQSNAFGAAFSEMFQKRRAEADEFYKTIAPEGLSDDAKNVQRQALAGLLWSKQFYNYDVQKWLCGDAKMPAPPAMRHAGRNNNWTHFNSHDILSMPDKWEYPWFASWDLAFHTIPLVLVDSDFAKEQLILLLREWFMHPNGQMPAYEWNFGDVNPPVHAWAALRVFRIEKRRRGQGDYNFLERVFHKLLLNFTWWVNRKDADDRNVFQGGFLGLDNIGLFDRSQSLPGGARLDQSDGTSWMAMYCLNMLAIALELAAHDETYEDVATKFLEHFFYIANAMNDRPAACGDDGTDLWDNQDQFYYDVLHLPDGTREFLRVRSLVGLIPLLAVDTLEAPLLERLPGFRGRLEWFLKNHPELTHNFASLQATGEQSRRLFAAVDEERLRHILRRMLDESEFLSPYGLRSVSRHYAEKPYQLQLDGQCFTLDYQPAESRTNLFGGNSNWRGPIWFPINYLIIEALQKFDHFYGDDFKIECPTGSGQFLNLWEVATELSQRLISVFTQDENGRRAVFGGIEKLQSDPHFKDYILFYEYFHGDNGAGLGASHQTGWTALVAKLIQQSGQ
ncbi:MAG TPA: hypothetical protein VGB77_19450, partial [Abditibacteriaceae bacterium]